MSFSVYHLQLSGFVSDFADPSDFFSFLIFMVSIYCVSASLFLFPTVVVFLFFLVLAFILLPFWPRHCHVTHRRFPAVACKILFLATALRGLIYIRFGKQGSRAARSGSSEQPPPLPLEPRRSFLAEPLGRSSQGRRRRFSCRAPPPQPRISAFLSRGNVA